MRGFKRLETNSTSIVHAVHGAGAVVQLTQHLYWMVVHEQARRDKLCSHVRNLLRYELESLANRGQHKGAEISS